MVRRRRSKSTGGGSCSILKKKISAARTRTARGKALGKFAKAGCAQKARRKHRR